VNFSVFWRNRYVGCVYLRYRTLVV
jgi:hypothetical protein